MAYDKTFKHGKTVVTIHGEYEVPFTKGNMLKGHISIQIVPAAARFSHNSAGSDERPDSKMAKRAQDRSKPITILNPSDILTPDELVAKVRRTWVYQKMRRRSQNPLPAIKLGRFRRFSWPSVCEWLHAQSSGPTGENL